MPHTQLHITIIPLVRSMVLKQTVVSILVTLTFFLSILTTILPVLVKLKVVGDTSRPQVYPAMQFWESLQLVFAGSRSNQMSAICLACWSWLWPLAGGGRLSTAHIISIPSLPWPQSLLLKMNLAIRVPAFTDLGSAKHQSRVHETHQTFRPVTNPSGCFRFTLRAKEELWY